MVNFNRRFAEPYVTARDGFGAEGPRLVVAEKNRAGSEYRASFENAIHMIDLLPWCCGEAVEVSAHAHAGDPYAEEDLAALLRFDSGATGVLVGWVEARVTLGFQAAVDHFVARVTDRAPVASDGLSGARTQELLERILVAAGLPLEDAPGTQWVSHAAG